MPTAPQTAIALYSSGLPILEALAVLISGAFIAGSIYIIMKTGWLRVRIDRVEDVVLHADTARKRVARSWDSIERNFFSGDDNQLKIAILKADILLEEALKEAGVAGKDLGERLRKVRSSELPNIDNVWEAHKLRNKIAHEPDFILKRDTAERALTVYEEALSHLGALAQPVSSEA